MNNTPPRISLKLLTPDDVSQDYVKWMLDEEVNQFLESRWKTYSLDNLKEYVKSMSDCPSDYLFGIFLNENNKHIGNIKIGNVDQFNKNANLGIIIGDKKLWGKGFGSEAIYLATKYAFEELKLHKIIAGMYINNISSYKAFKNNGYREAGILREHAFYKDTFIDQYLMEKINS